MKLAFLVFGFGVVPTYMALEHFDWLWWLGYAILLVVVWISYRKIDDFRSEANAAFNIVMAQVTFGTLDKAEKRKVEAYAKRMYSVFEGDLNAVFENEMQKLAFIAMAMGDTGIKPVILLRKWFYIKDPSKVPRANVIAKVMELAKESVMESKNA